MTRSKLLAGVAIFTIMAMPTAHAGSLYAFGDSLSDNGNMYSVFQIQPTEGGGRKSPFLPQLAARILMVAGIPTVPSG